MDLKEQFDATIGHTPATSIDVDATMTRMRRRMWTVRGTAAAMTVGLAAAGAMLAWPMLANTQQPSPNSGQQRAELPAAATPETEQAIAARLTGAVQAKLGALLPGATLVPNWAGHDAAVVYPERPVAVPTTLPWNQMRAQADVQDQLGTGFVDVLIGRTTADPNATDYCLPEGAIARQGTTQATTWAGECSVRAPMGYPLGIFASCAEYDEVLDGEDTCTEQTTAAGDHVVMLRGTHQFRVDVARADGTAVIVMSGSRAHAGGTRPTPSLTIEQMVALATDPGLAL
ncbi:hypothetical protein Rhe02_78050 [Rhizocola hellebori]|uniref:Uncharacterized protein n=1 Tax=Rhizocola hellebori TaxID=1392758 RepID=A0A8J3QF51_9ACTN|nr:hypothetical protein [Rhizocola hellebori]GIH09738.1 hypothetical protein Rhe02_78050 [Rhizocola hellebori]